MKKFFQIGWLLLVIPFVSGCATSGYLADRGRDAADIFTLGVGAGAGAKARVGPFQTGLMADLPLAGLRGGELTSNTRGGWFPDSSDFQAIIAGGESFMNTELNRGKEFEAGTTANDIFTPFFNRLEFDYRAPYYYTQLEAVIGVGLTFRIGLNPGEAVDFVLGWFGIDLFFDDRHGRPAEPD